MIAAALALSFASPARADTLERVDGSNITYHLLNRAAENRQGIILMLQGSGCEPVIERDWLNSKPLLLAPGRVVLAIEKYGVPAGTSDPSSYEDNCPTAYWRGNTLHQRVLDAAQVIAHLRGEPWWNGELIIHGGSEGGAVAAMLGPLLPETRAIMIVSSGIGVTVGELIRSAVLPPVAAHIPRILSEAADNPSPDLRFGGESYKWWADAANVLPARMLLQTNVPILLVHGSRDQFAPVATARATNDLLLASGATNLTYLELEGYDHFMVDETGTNRSNDVVGRMAVWLENNR